jgi:hypothetical protein
MGRVIVKKKKLFISIGILLVLILGLVFTILFIESSAIATIISTLIGSAITFFVGQIYDAATSGISHFTGYYRDEIFSNDDPTKIIKRDKFELIERSGSVLSGKFIRYVPERSKITHWKCSGFIVLDQFLLSYRATKDVTPSRGVLLVKLDTCRTNGLLPCYTGKYFKFEGEVITAHKINLIKIEKSEYDNL